jgi:tetratricopeptide (TPR) repeat protein
LYNNPSHRPKYCYRHFPRDYGLVIWLNSETIDTLITDFRQLLSDLANTNTEIDKSSDEIVEEVRTRLFRSNVPWLIVFDNADRIAIDVFVPRGAGTKGHVLVTTRHVKADSSGTLILGCLRTSEAIELLRRSAGSTNMAGPSNSAAAKDLCEKLGNLPLALSMAAAYMRQCEVECSEYLHRYTISENNGQSLLLQGPGETTVASSLSLILPKIKEENQITSEVLNLLSFVGPDVITKSLFRNLISAKKNFDERKTKKQVTTIGSLPACLILSGVALMSMNSRLLPTTGKQMAALIILFSTASSIVMLSLSREAVSDKAAPPTKPIDTESRSFSSFIYEQSDISWDILKSFSLLSVKEGKGSVHRLLAAAMRSCQTKEESLYYITICIDAMLACWTFQADKSESWKNSLQLLEHVKTVVLHSLEYEIDQARLLKVARLSKEAGVLSAMALNAFVEAHTSIEIALKLLEKSPTIKQADIRKAKAESLYELSKVLRYQGRYDDANKCLLQSLGLNNTGDCLTADTLHELGILEIKVIHASCYYIALCIFPSSHPTNSHRALCKRHNLDAATFHLQKSLEIRRGLDDTNSDRVNASATLHQLAAVHVARKPPSLDMAKALLQEALGLSRQIGQRAATIKQLARVTLRQGFLDQAQSYLDQALELYLELYGENKLHINIAAVRFQQGALALQRSRLSKNDETQSLDSAWRCFHECLKIRRHVYAYASPVGNSLEDTNPIHLEVSSVLHELGLVGLAQKHFTQAMRMLDAERSILEKLAQTAPRDMRIHQARLNNLNWLKKCTKEMGDDITAEIISDERLALKNQFGHEHGAKKIHVSCESSLLQEKSMKCRWLARKYALDKSPSKNKPSELMKCLGELREEIGFASPGPMREAASQFLETLLDASLGRGRSKILAACDSLRNALRAHGIQVDDSKSSY